MAAVVTNSCNDTITQYNVQTGTASNTLNQVAPSATSGVPLISQGASSQPVFGTAVVSGGGTGDTSFTEYSVVTGGTTSTGSLQNVSGVGTSGQVLTSNGASALPTWQTAGSGSSGANSVVSMVDDFIVTVNSGLNIISSAYGWIQPNNGWTITASPSYSTNPGIIYNNNIAPNFLSSNSISSRIILGAGQVFINWVVIFSTLSTSSHRYTVNIGLGDTNTPSQSNGVYFSYTDNVNSGNWQIVTANSGTLTTTNTSTAVSTGFVNCGIVINAAGTSAQFFINGVSQGTISTNIPTTNPIGPIVVMNFSSSAVTNLFGIDLFYMTIDLTTPR